MTSAEAKNNNKGRRKEAAFELSPLKTALDVIGTVAGWQRWQLAAANLYKLCHDGKCHHDHMCVDT